MNVCFHYFVSFICLVIMYNVYDSSNSSSAASFFDDQEKLHMRIFSMLSDHLFGLFGKLVFN